jgi:hypothetical protein
MKPKINMIAVLFFLTLALTSFCALTLIAYSADEVLTPEKLCGIWEGTFSFSTRDLPRVSSRSKLLITNNLNGIFVYGTTYLSSTRILDGQGEIVNNQLLMREKVLTRIKLKMNENNMLEGEGVTNSLDRGYLIKLKKVRELNDEEKQKTLEELVGLLK